MRPPLIQRSRRSIPHRTRERGVTMALVALAVVGVVAMAGLSIDVGTLYQASAEAQRAADAGALAAARIISMQGLTGDPNETQPPTWSQICGGSASAATSAANAVVGQNPISGASTPPVPTVSYYYSGASPGPDCSTLGGGQAGINMLVQVQVQQTNLPTYFARIWGRTGNTVTATATAEVFNPSSSGTYASTGNPIPVQPRCVKPWVIPNLDPPHSGANCTSGVSGCISFVDTTTGAIKSPGVVANGAGVIGERFWLMVDCGNSAPCVPPQNPPEANYNPVAPYAPNTLQYLPGQASFPSIAVPSDGTTACSNAASSSDYYAQAIAGCDQSTRYQCGVQQGNVVDLSENPGLPATEDTTNGVQCLIHESTPSAVTLLSGQDALLPLQSPPSYPFQIQIGTSSPLLGANPPVPGGGVISSSNSIVSLPIYDSTQTISGSGTTQVTIIGFLQVFINTVDSLGDLNVTVLNVSGCGNAATSATPYLNGTSSVPIRLITPP
jgi:putative Flp pilus-assembly TadE/G-like protein